ncbi:MAG: CotH kinase family protein [Bacteroidota bacterium]
MRLHTPPPPPTRSRRPLALAGLAVLATGAIALLAYVAGVYNGVYRTRQMQEQMQTVRGLPELAGNWLQSLTADAPPALTIDLSRNNYQRLAIKREEALKRGKLITSADDFVPAEIRFEGETIPIRIRLKGDETDHLEGDAWSFRVHVRGDRTLLGMKRFSLHHPRTRNYAHEWLFHRIVGDEGLIGLRYRFVDVQVNGRDVGLYALEEHFDKRLVEFNRRREGAVVRFDESGYWETFGTYGPTRIGMSAVPIIADAFQTAQPDGFGTSTALADSSSRAGYVDALTLLEAYQSGQRPGAEVFDVPKLARFLALADVFGGWHGTHWNNTRFYLNPVTVWLEPVVFDTDAGRSTRMLASGVGSRLHWRDNVVQLLTEPAIAGAYVRELERVSRPAYVDSVLAANADALDATLRTIHRSYPTYTFDPEVYRDNARYLRWALQPPVIVHAYARRAAPGRVQIDAGNVMSLPIELLAISDAPLGNPILLPGKLRENPTAYRSFTVEGNRVDSLRLTYRLLGSDSTRTAAITPHARRNAPTLDAGPTRMPATTDRFPFLTDDGATVRIPTGTWAISEPLVIPEGRRLILDAGTTLDLTNEALIVVRGPVEAVGTRDAPVRMVSSDSTGQGLVVVEAGATSQFEHVQIIDQGTPEQAGWTLTGAVTFYESPLVARHTTFAGSRGEDQLNFIRTTFELSDTDFAGTRSDALDADFTEGRLARVDFRNCGNDCVDVSGTVLEMHDVTVRGAGDKALSVGEGSEVVARGFIAVDANLGVAGKDRSTVTLDGGRILGAQVGYTVFQKKPEFGGAVVFATGMRVEAGIPYLLQPGSVLRLDGTDQCPNENDPEGRLYGVEFGAASQ